MLDFGGLYSMLNPNFQPEGLKRPKMEFLPGDLGWWSRAEESTDGTGPRPSCTVSVFTRVFSGPENWSKVWQNLTY